MDVSNRFRPPMSLELLHELLHEIASTRSTGAVRNGSLEDGLVSWAGVLERADGGVLATVVVVHAVLHAKDF
jgi:hypothetical protein